MKKVIIQIIVTILFFQVLTAQNDSNVDDDIDKIYKNFELQDSRKSTTNRNPDTRGSFSLIDTNLDQIANELLQHLGEIALKRATKNGLLVLQNRIVDMLMEVKIEKYSVFDNTAKYLKNTPIIAAINYPELFKQKLTDDLLSLCKYVANHTTMDATDKVILDSFVKMIFDPIINQNYTISYSDIERNFSLFLDKYLFSVQTHDYNLLKVSNKTSKEIAALIAIKIGYIYSKENNGEYDLSYFISNITDVTSFKTDYPEYYGYLCEIAYSTNDILSQNTKPIEALSSYSNLVFNLIELSVEGNSQDYIKKLHELCNSIIQRNYIIALQKVLVLIDIYNPEKIDVSSKSMATLTLLTQYIETYRDTTNLTDHQIKHYYQQRELLLETLIDASTSNAIETGRVKVSLSANVGAGVSWQKKGLWDSDNEKQSIYAGYLPIGISANYFCYKNFGFNFMFYPIDLGQYIFINEDELELATVSWKDAITLGVQIGVTTGFLGPNSIISFLYFYQYTPDIQDLNDRKVGLSNMGLRIVIQIPFYDLN